MTAIVGALCQDGVVIGSDSSVTFGTGSTKTIEQPTEHKITIVKSNLIMAGTGAVGLGQRFVHILEDPDTPTIIQKRKPIQAAVDICKRTVENFMGTGASKGAFGALLAFESGGKYHLCEFAAADFQPELKTVDCWFVSMGSGQPILDPFMALLRKIFWRHSQPMVSDGVFAITWALLHAIDVNPGGINAPPRIAVLERSPDAKQTTARMLSEAELLEHVSNVSGVEEYLRAYGDKERVSRDTEISPPPNPPSPR